MISLDAVHQLALDALMANGFSKPQANAIATTVTAAERDGCTSHGLFRIPFYIAALKNPRADAQAEPSLSVTESSVVHVDARNGFCPLALQTGLDPLQEKTKRHGIAALAIHNTFNIAALWPEVEALANEGLVAFAFTAANAYVAPAGGTKPLFGTNPMAFGFPRKDHPPLVFDQASSASARGEIQLHLRDGKPLPEGWAIDKHGKPTTDPTAALEGAQLPFGGYKGSSLALMVELLAGALIGDMFSTESSAADTHGTGAPFGGEFILAIDPHHCAADNRTSNTHLDRAELLFGELLSQAGTRLPSDRRYKVREANLENGVSVNAALLEELSRSTR